MFHIFDQVIPLSKLPEWIAFDQSHEYYPIQGNWTCVYQQGTNTIETTHGELKQTFYALPALVDLDDIDDLLETNPYGNIRELEFYGGGEVGTPSRGYEWDDGTTRTFDGVEIDRFLTSFRYNRPQLEPGIIDYHDLVEDTLGDYVTYHTDDLVIRFSGDKWEQLTFGDPTALDNDILHIDIQTGYLLDYLDVRDAALVIGYFESREVHYENQMINIEEKDHEPVDVFNGPALRFASQTTGLSTIPSGELHWLCPIYPTTSDASAQRQLEENKEAKFVTLDGNEFSVKDIEEGVPGSASHTDWVFFDMDVLEKYIKSDNGTVEWTTAQMGNVEWQDLMIQRIFRNKEYEVVILLEDLKKIPASKVPHWKAHNRTPQGGVPDHAITTYVKGEFVDEDADPSYSSRVMNAIDALAEQFQSVHGSPMLGDPREHDPVDQVIMPARNEKDQLLDAMEALNEVFFERIGGDHIENIQHYLPKERAEEVDGSKSALYEMAVYLFDESRAGDLLDPLNAVYDLRVDRTHRGNSKWQRAMDAVDMSRPVRDYRGAYIEIMTQVAESIEEIEEELN